MQWCQTAHTKMVSAFEVFPNHFLSATDDSNILLLVNPIYCCSYMTPEMMFATKQYTHIYFEWFYYSLMVKIVMVYLLLILTYHPWKKMSKHKAIESACTCDKKYSQECLCQVSPASGQAVHGGYFRTVFFSGMRAISLHRLGQRLYNPFSSCSWQKCGSSFGLWAQEGSR